MRFVKKFEVMYELRGKGKNSIFGFDTIKGCDMLSGVETKKCLWIKLFRHLYLQ